MELVVQWFSKNIITNITGLCMHGELGSAGQLPRRSSCYQFIDACSFCNSCETRIYSFILEITGTIMVQKFLEVPQKLYEAASDCICSTLFMCEDSPSYYSLAQLLQEEVQKLLPEFQEAIRCEDASRLGRILNSFLILMFHLFLFYCLIEHAAFVAYSQKWQRLFSITWFINQTQDWEDFICWICYWSVLLILIMKYVIW